MPAATYTTLQVDTLLCASIIALNDVDVMSVTTDYRFRMQGGH
jgi:hypothetical protein